VTKNQTIAVLVLLRESLDIISDDKHNAWSREEQ